MRQGDRAELRMQKVLHTGVTYNDAIYTCELLRYDKSEECLYLSANCMDLTAFSLDAIYFCEIQSDLECLQCTGRIKERSRQKEGKILKFEIENGFYKINIKLVDKQRA